MTPDASIPQPDDSAELFRKRRTGFFHTLRAKLIVGLTPGLVALLILLGVSLKATDILVASNQHLAEAGQELAITRAIQVRLGQIQLFLDEQSPLTPDADTLRRFRQQADLLDQQFANASSQYGEAGEKTPFHQALTLWEDAREQALRLLDPNAPPRSEQERQLLEATLVTTLQETQTELQALSDAVKTEMDRTVAASQRAHDQSSLILIASITVALLLGLLFMIWFSHYLTRPLAQLTESARRLGAGDLGVRSPVRQQDEIGDLAREFNLMAEQLQRRNQELEAVSAERTAYAQDLQRVLHRNVQIQEDERKRIANDIHDGVSQWLMGGMFEVQAALVRLTASQQAVREHLLSAQSVLKEVKEEMRRVIYDLHPPLLESHGLVTALRSLTQDQATRFQVPHHLEVNGTPYRLPQDQELALFRIAQEALNNIHRHAQASQIWVRLAYEPDQMILSIEDDGQGFDLSPERGSHHGHLGLTSMRERAISVGAAIAIQSVPQKGTRVQVTVPSITPSSHTS